MKNAVVIKSLHNGIALYLDEEMEFEALLPLIADKFKQSSRFFKDAPVALSIEGRSLEAKEEQRVVDAITENSSLKILCIIGKDEEDQFYRNAMEEYRLKQEGLERAGQFYRGTLKRGQIFETEESVIVLGDVGQGATIISAKDIVVLGGLYGSACAGGNGQPGHFIAALEMTPQKLKIGAFKYISKEKRSWFAKTVKVQPQMAYAENGRIILKPITNELLNGLGQ